MIGTPMLSLAFVIVDMLDALPYINRRYGGGAFLPPEHRIAIPRISRRYGVSASFDVQIAQCHRLHPVGAGVLEQYRSVVGKREGHRTFVPSTQERETDLCLPAMLPCSLDDLLAH